MADSKRKTANLFDKTAESVKSTTTYNFTITGLDPNKYYTCSTNFEKNSDVASLYFGGGASVANGVWSGYAKTFQPDADGGLLVAIRYATAGTDAPTIINDVMAGTIWIMVNEGTEALPYEPYGWLHSLRKLTTATDTLTTLPADIYADGNNATVGLVGNMQQTTLKPSEVELTYTGWHDASVKEWDGSEWQ